MKELVLIETKYQVVQEDFDVTPDSPVRGETSKQTHGSVILDEFDDYETALRFALEHRDALTQKEYCTFDSRPSKDYTYEIWNDWKKLRHGIKISKSSNELNRSRVVEKELEHAH